MLDHFLEVAVRADSDHRDSVKLAADLQRLPNELLYKLATGEVKLSYGENDEWLEKYHGTPMFDEAVQLEHADLENEVARQQASAANQSEQFYKTQEQIRLQKKMLDLKLIEASEQQGRQMAPGGQLPESITPTAQGAGALGDTMVEGVQDGAPGGVGTKMASANFEKAALNLAGDAGKGILGFARTHTGALGAAGGAVLGATTASRDEHGNKHWVRGALGGAAIGGALGHAGGGIGNRMSAAGGGMGFGDAVKGYGTGIAEETKKNWGSLVEGFNSKDPAKQLNKQLNGKLITPDKTPIVDVNPHVGAPIDRVADNTAHLEKLRANVDAKINHNPAAFQGVPMSSASVRGPGPTSAEIAGFPRAGTVAPPPVAAPAVAPPVSSTQALRDRLAAVRSRNAAAGTVVPPTAMAAV